MDKKRIKITMKVFDEIKPEFLETAEFIDDRLERGCSREYVTVEEVILFTCVEPKS